MTTFYQQCLTAYLQSQDEKVIHALAKDFIKFIEDRGLICTTLNTSFSSYAKEDKK